MIPPGSVDERANEAGSAAPAPQRRGGAAGCLGSLLLVVSLPAGGLGLWLYLADRSANAAGSGAGLKGLGAALGTLLLVAAGVAFVVGALLYAYSARKSRSASLE